MTSGPWGPSEPSTNEQNPSALSPMQPDPEHVVTYQDRLTKHLAEYRSSVLEVAEAGTFHYRGRDLPKEHILDPEAKWLNILPGVRDRVKAFVSGRPTIRLHRYFHHLNSSQALALNLFVPFFGGDSNSASNLLRALGQTGSLRQWALESVPVPKEETNIDVTWETTDGLQTVCEVKLSETDFGAAEADEPHLGKLRDIYRPVLERHLPQSCLDPSTFCANYQVFRNVWHMLRLDNSVLLFLLPRANEGLWSRLSTTLKMLPEAVRNRVRVEALEDVLDRLCADGTCSPLLQAHADGLRQKYICD